MPSTITSVCVYCASSNSSGENYQYAAERLGELLAQSGITVVYGGGKAGSMGRLAKGALKAGGQVIGFIPEFMAELEWAHDELSQLHLVESMHERKEKMMMSAQGIVALPGGVGTFEELLEAMAWKRLGITHAPIVIVNQDGFYDGLIALLERSLDDKFMHPDHKMMWNVVEDVEEVVSALRNAPQWHENARSFAQV